MKRFNLHIQPLSIPASDTQVERGMVCNWDYKNFNSGLNDIIVE